MSDPLRSAASSCSSPIVFSSHTTPATSSSSSQPNSIFLSHHSSSRLPNASTPPLLYSAGNTGGFAGYPTTRGVPARRGSGGARQPRYARATRPHPFAFPQRITPGPLPSPSHAHARNSAVQKPRDSPRITNSTCPDARSIDHRRPKNQHQNPPTHQNHAAAS